MNSVLLKAYIQTDDGQDKYCTLWHILRLCICVKLFIYSTLCRLPFLMTWPRQLLKKNVLFIEFKQQSLTWTLKTLQLPAVRSAARVPWVNLVQGKCTEKENKIHTLSKWTETKITDVILRQRGVLRQRLYSTSHYSFKQT